MNGTLTAFERAIPGILSVEGGFSDDPADRGGPTNHGIAEVVARAFGYKGNMRDLPVAVALDIYKQRYWDTIRGDDIAAISEPIARELLDTGVNMGQTVAATFLQRCLNSFNREQKDYPDTKVDGLLGKMTVYNLRMYLSKRGAKGERVMLRALNSLQGCKYIGISENNSTQEVFVYGWFDHRVVM